MGAIAAAGVEAAVSAGASYIPLTPSPPSSLILPPTSPCPHRPRKTHSISIKRNTTPRKHLITLHHRAPPPLAQHSRRALRVPLKASNDVPVWRVFQVLHLLLQDVLLEVREVALEDLFLVYEVVELRALFLVVGHAGAVAESGCAGGFSHGCWREKVARGSEVGGVLVERVGGVAVGWDCGLQ